MMGTAAWAKTERQHGIHPLDKGYKMGEETRNKQRKSQGMTKRLVDELTM
jgi:hypothetical protein